jgi:hypothetical protein
MNTTPPTYSVQQTGQLTRIHCDAEPLDLPTVAARLNGMLADAEALNDEIERLRCKLLDAAAWLGFYGPLCSSPADAKLLENEIRALSSPRREA